MKLTAHQERVIAESRELLDNPDALIPGVYAPDDYHYRNAFLLGYTRSQLTALLRVAEELAAAGDES